MIDRELIINKFIDYTSNYDLKDPKVKLKYDHTFRVASLCEQIAKSIALDKPDCDLAWLTGMLHDIGRFEQVRRFGTFIDAESIDHAQFGADLLFEEGLYLRFMPDDGVDVMEMDLYLEMKEIVELAIRNHNAFEIQTDLSEREKVFCNILRDADKIDIFRVNYETPLEDIYNTTTEKLKCEGVTEEVKQSFNREETVLRSYKKTTVDHVVGHVSLVFGLVYPLSVELVKKQGFLDKLLNFESENDETEEWFAYMREYMQGYFERNVDR